MNYKEEIIRKWKPCVIFINGLPGVGKLSVARMIKEILGDSVLLMDNHTLHDPANLIAPRGSPENAQARRSQRRVIFDSLKTLGPDSTIVFTSCTAYNENDKAVFAEYLDVARARGQDFKWLNFSVREHEHLRRATDAERSADGSKKLTDRDTILSLRRHQLLKPEDVQDLLDSAPGQTQVKIQFGEADITRQHPYQTGHSALAYCCGIGSAMLGY